MAALLAQGLVYSVHSGLVLSRADTRNLTRDWMVAHIPRGRAIVVEPVVARRLGARIGRPAPTAPAATAGASTPSLYSRIAADGRARARAARTKSASRTTSARSRPALIGYYEQHGYCWVVTGSTQSGRAFADPRAVPLAIAYYRALAAQGEVVYRASPYARGSAPVAFNFDWSFDYYPLAYHRPGPAMTVYRLHGGRCAALSAGPDAPARVILSSDDGELHRHRPSCTCERADRARRAAASARVKPNPVVGAVVARDGEVLGEGWHERVRRRARRGQRDRGLRRWPTSTGATLYVSLEPCCHEGKTPPCTDAILQAGIRRVVVASDDPTEKASGPRPRASCATRASRSCVADGELARARAAAQPGLPQARAHRAARGCCSSRR